MVWWRTPRADGPRAAAEVLKLIEAQLTDARSVASSLQTRATGIVSASGALIALFLGLAALVTSADGYKPPLLTSVLLALAVVLLAASGVFVLLVARPVRTGMADLDSLRAISTPQVLELPASLAYPRMAEAQIQLLEIARELNRAASLQVLWATILGIMGVTSAAFGAAYALVEGAT